MKINLHELLLENRHESVESGYGSFTEKMAWKMWKQAMLRRKWMNMANGGMKNRVVNSLMKSWTAHRGKLEFPRSHLTSFGKKNMVGNKLLLLATAQLVFS